jgi:hypothetical protein
MLTTIALIYKAYVGCEVIADDLKNNHTQKTYLGILICYGDHVCHLYPCFLRDIGTIPSVLGGSRDRTDRRSQLFMAKIWVPIMGSAGTSPPSPPGIRP